MTSWMMSLWLKNHEESEWPDLSISQPEGACHVSIKDESHFERAIEEMCSEGFFTVHGYRYVQGNAAAERVPDELYDDVKGIDCIQSTQDEELYKEAITCQPRGSCNFRSPQELPDPNALSIDHRYKNVRVDVTKTDLTEEENYEDPNALSIDHRYKNVRVDVTKTDLTEEENYEEVAGQHDDCLKDVSNEPRYQNVQINVTKTILQEEELYKNVRSTKGVVDSKEPRYQNVQIDVAETAVDMVTEVLHDDEDYDDISCEEQIDEDQSWIYEEIGNQSPASCQSSTDEYSKNINTENEHPYTAEDVGKEIAVPEDEELYEEIAGAVISNSVEACGLINPGSSDLNESPEAVGCDEFTSNLKRGSFAAEGEVQNHADPVYAEIGSLQLAGIRSNHNTGGQSTIDNPDTPGYRKLMPREYMSLRREQGSTLNPNDNSPTTRDITKLNSRRRRCNSRETSESVWRQEP